MEFWLPHIFAAVMGLALLMYVILDGYDLGVGLLLPFAETDRDKDTMVSSIGPFWDANETWIVLGVGVLLIAFPKAHGLILTSLYLPATLMLMGLVLRGMKNTAILVVTVPSIQPCLPSVRCWPRSARAGCWVPTSPAWSTTCSPTCSPSWWR